MLIPQKMLIQKKWQLEFSYVYLMQDFDSGIFNFEDK